MNRVVRSPAQARARSAARQSNRLSRADDGDDQPVTASESSHPQANIFYGLSEHMIRQLVKEEISAFLTREGKENITRIRDAVLQTSQKFQEVYNNFRQSVARTGDVTAAFPVGSRNSAIRSDSLQTLLAQLQRVTERLDVIESNMDLYPAGTVHSQDSVISLDSPPPRKRRAPSDMGLPSETKYRKPHLHVQNAFRDLVRNKMGISVRDPLPDWPTDTDQWPKNTDGQPLVRLKWSEPMTSLTNRAQLDPILQQMMEQRDRYKVPESVSGIDDLFHLVKGTLHSFKYARAHTGEAAEAIKRAKRHDARKRRKAREAREAASVEDRNGNSNSNANANDPDLAAALDKSFMSEEESDDDESIALPDDALRGHNDDTEQWITGNTMSSDMLASVGGPSQLTSTAGPSSMSMGAAPLYLPMDGQANASGLGAAGGQKRAARLI